MVGRTGRAAAAAVSGAAAAAVLLGGCTGDADAGGHSSDRIASSPAEEVRGAADVLARSGTSRTTTTMSMDSGGTKITVRGSGGFDYARRRGRLTVVLPADASGERVRKPLGELIVPGWLYMKNRGAGVPEGKWVRVDTATLPDGNLVTGGATDPVTAADLLRGAREVELVGTTTVGGVRVRHFRGVSDIARAAEAVPEAAAKPLRAAARGFTGGRVPFDAYLDDRGRLRRIEQVFTFTGAAGAGAGRRAESRVVVRSVTELHDFGARVVVELPDAADVYHGKVVSPAVP
ncbi:hypothetical protein ACFW9F_09955 [Streptomyces sp. NPDC059506]|uniref:hypothetical protein n=1 Tax=Streptomyces sp. NPDC059506 TaxID=3347751 RepID=UPI003689DB80